MTPATRRLLLAVAAIWVVSLAGVALGVFIDGAALLRAWLCSYLFWLGVPLGGVTLILVHDLSGGAWMTAARPALLAAAATMPLATLAALPAFLNLGALYPWAHPSYSESNAFYLNTTDFYARWAAYAVLWNLLAAYATLGPRYGGRPIASGLSWISALALVALAFSAAFAAIDWILSLEPKFWSSVFSYIQSASWFNTGMAAVTLAVAMTAPGDEESRGRMSDIARILLATTIFWAYVEFVQYLIIWEENLRDEIPWYVKRLHTLWRIAAYVVVLLGFFIPFLALLWAPTKRNRGVLVAACASILLSRVAETWALVLPETDAPARLWLDAAALLTLGGPVGALFALSWRVAMRNVREAPPSLRTEHG